MTTKTVTTSKLINREIANDVIEGLWQKSAKLEALLVNAYGESGESFRNLNNDLQDTYIWACSDLAGEIKELVKRL